LSRCATLNGMNMDQTPQQHIQVARVTGIWYLLLAISGMLGFLLLHGKIYQTDNPQQTLENLVNKLFIARTRLVLELVIITSQALAAVWFYRLFRNINPWAAWAVGAFGLVNAVAIMISAISMGSAIEIANASGTEPQSKLVMIQLLGQLIKHAWGIGGIFFGLWLLPMGYIVMSSKCMPYWLGCVLIAGGIGYLLMTFLGYAGIKSSILEFVVLPATVGEFWMIGYLLVFGIRTKGEL
jgi:hypothetical protein